MFRKQEKEEVQENMNLTRAQMIIWDIRYLRQQVMENDSQLTLGFISSEEHLRQLKQLYKKTDDIEFLIEDMKDKGELYESL